eukprot:TRINITY_DN47194_c0_g1_i1.p1 TRINITY_DN47194_c0_g1~~TRINITY_DN47194_c0_g1_i1.p1  ORF type:complete len:904 (+),score=167.12 TRINITY_DN47194_c0_g1_i1:112-2823(+)
MGHCQSAVRQVVKLTGKRHQRRRPQEISTDDDLPSRTRHRHSIYDGAKAISRSISDSVSAAVSLKGQKASSGHTNFSDALPQHLRNDGNAITDQLLQTSLTPERNRKWVALSTTHESMPEVRGPMLAEENESEDEFTWMFEFQVPSAVTDAEQKAFERMLRTKEETSTQFIARVFENLLERKEVEHMMLHPGPTSLKEPVKEPLKEPLLPIDMAVQDFPDSRSRAQRCVIHIVIAFLSKTLNDACDVCEVPEAVTSVAFLSNNGDRIFVCARLSVEAAELFAELGQYPVQLCMAGVNELGIKISDKDTSLAYVAYNDNIRKYCRQHQDAYSLERSTVLRHNDRIRILLNEIRKRMNLSELQGSGLLSSYSPLHLEHGLCSLKRCWGLNPLLPASYCEMQQPLDDVHEYFGEEITLYFAFLQELCNASLVLAAIVLTLWALSRHLKVWRGLLWPKFCIFVVAFIWYRIFVSLWRHREKCFENKWGFEAHQLCRVGSLPNYRFKGKMLPSPENENVKSIQVSARHKKLGRLAAAVLTGLLLLLLGAVIAVEQLLFWKLSGRYSGGSSSAYLSCAWGTFSGLQIKVIDSLWSRMSDWITDLEHRVNLDDFLWSKRVKGCIVRFLTSISSVALFAFLQPALCFYDPREQTELQDCMEHSMYQLEKQLVSLFVTRYMILAGTINDVIRPWLTLEAKRYFRSETETSLTILQADMLEYESDDYSSDWLDVLVPLGFVMLFGTSSPPIFFLMILILAHQVRCDAWKLCYVYRRPYPCVVKDIGVFDAMLGFFGYAMIVTNLVFLRMEFGSFVAHWLEHVMPANLVESMEGFGSGFFGLLFVMIWKLLELMMPSETIWLRLEKRRQDLQRQKTLQSQITHRVAHIMSLQASMVEHSMDNNVQQQEKGRNKR